MNLGKLWEMGRDREAWRCGPRGRNDSWETDDRERALESSTRPSGTSTSRKTNCTHSPTLSFLCCCWPYASSVCRLEWPDDFHLNQNDSWTVKSTTRWRIEAFKLGCWRRRLRIPWTERRSNQSILSIHWEICGWSWSSNTLTAWFKEWTHWKRPWCWERLKAKGEGGGRGWDG